MCIYWLTGDTRRMVDGSNVGRLKNTTDRIDGAELKDRRTLWTVWAPGISTGEYPLSLGQRPRTNPEVRATIVSGRSDFRENSAAGSARCELGFVCGFLYDEYSRGDRYREFVEPIQLSLHEFPLLSINVYTILIYVIMRIVIKLFVSHIYGRRQGSGHCCWGVANHWF